MALYAMSSFRNRSILIANEGKAFITYIAIILKRMGFTVIPSENVRDIFKLLEVMEPDIIFLGNAASADDPTVILKELQGPGAKCNAPVFIVSEILSDEERERLLEAGAAGFIDKPVEIERLHEIIQQCIFNPLGINRRNLRIPFSRRVNLWHEGRSFNLGAETLSEGGIFFRHMNPLPNGAEVFVTLPDDEFEPVNLKGVVIYSIKNLPADVFSTSPGFAVEFQDASRSEIDDLKSYIVRLLTQDIKELAGDEESQDCFY